MLHLCFLIPLFPCNAIGLILICEIIGGRGSPQKYCYEWCFASPLHLVELCVVC